MKGTDRQAGRQTGKMTGSEKQARQAGRKNTWPGRTGVARHGLLRTIMRETWLASLLRLSLYFPPHTFGKLTFHSIGLFTSSILLLLLPSLSFSWFLAL